MKLWDSHRRRLNDLPELIGRRNVVPRLTLYPAADNTVTIGAFIPDARNGKYAARQVLRTVTETEIPKIIAAYRDDPEETLETLFNISLSSVAEPSDAQLLADLRAERDNGPKEESHNARAARLEI